MKSTPTLSTATTAIDVCALKWRLSECVDGWMSVYVRNCTATFLLRSQCYSLTRMVVYELRSAFALSASSIFGRGIFDTMCMNVNIFLMLFYTPHKAKWILLLLIFFANLRCTIKSGMSLIDIYVFEKSNEWVVNFNSVALPFSQ